jgi:hypothetical protein
MDEISELVRRYGGENLAATVGGDGMVSLDHVNMTVTAE